jgi:predicted transposase YbfD/YdcC
VAGGFFLPIDTSRLNGDPRVGCALDVVFREDDCRVRKGQAPENLALGRHIAVKVINQGKNHQAWCEE